MGGLGGRGKGARKRSRQQNSDRIFDRKNGEFVRNKAIKLPKSGAFNQQEDEQHLPRKLQSLLQRMGGNSQQAGMEAGGFGGAQAAAAAPEKRSRNKYKHLSSSSSSSASASSESKQAAGKMKGKLSGSRQGEESKGRRGGGSLWAEEEDEKEETVLEVADGEDAAGAVPEGAPEGEGEGSKHQQQQKERTKKNMSLSEVAATMPQQQRPAPQQPVDGGSRPHGTSGAPPEKVNSAKQLRKKARLARLHEKTQVRKHPELKREDRQADWDDRWTDKLDVPSFGEVAAQPPALTLKRKRGVNSTGGGLLEPSSKGKKLGAIMARQMAAVQAQQPGVNSKRPTQNSANKDVDAHERMRRQIIEQYRRKKGRAQALPASALRQLAGED